MPELSAGVLLYRRSANGPEVLLTHPGGPYWRNKDAGAWMLPKGGVEEGETLEGAARREFAEELGAELQGSLVSLGAIRQRGGKIVEAFAAEGELDCGAIASMTFELEWPPRSGRMQTFPEVDEARWFGIGEARTMILPSQLPLLDRLVTLLAG